MKKDFLLNKWSLFIQQILPATCVYCRSGHSSNFLLCETCLSTLELAPAHCRQCNRPLSALSDDICGYCLNHQTYVDKLVCPFLYAGGIEHLIKALKFHKKAYIAHNLAELFLHHITEQQLSPTPSCIVPVPIHWRRRLSRGFNQTEQLCSALANMLAIDSLSLVKRQHHRPPQSLLSGKVRHTNVVNNFRYHSSHVPEHVAIVDDVVTTGSTVNEIARVLKAAGVLQVDVWAMCMTSPNTLDRK
tara:strand:- start:5308 stop:6042 length:735 start_codon:yes stop_codon:yes gene_type:complete